MKEYWDYAGGHVARDPRPRCYWCGEHFDAEALVTLVITDARRQTVRSCRPCADSVTRHPVLGDIYKESAGE